MEKKNLRGEILSANQYKKYSVEYFPSRILFSVHVCIISKNQKIVYYQTKGNKIAIFVGQTIECYQFQDSNLICFDLQHNFKA